jgi:hypothetical protein
VRVRIEGYQPETPDLEPPSAAHDVARGAKVSISFRRTATPPDVVTASVSHHPPDPSDGRPCRFDAEAPATLVGDRVELMVPPSICLGPASVRVCVGYGDQPRVTACENATCQLESHFSTQDCQQYPLTITAASPNGPAADHGG